MREFASVVKATGKILSIQGWGNDEPYPSNIILPDGTEIIPILDCENSNVKYDTHIYDYATSAFVEIAPIIIVPPPSDSDRLSAIEEFMTSLL